MLNKEFKAYLKFLILEAVKQSKGNKIIDQLRSVIPSLIQEPKREVDLTIKDIGILLDGGVQNIKAVYNSANEDEKNFWGDWYFAAKDNVAKLSEKYSLPLEVVAAVVAVLSPGNRWITNLHAANQLIAGYQNAKRDGVDLVIKTNAYPENVKKAIEILKTGDVSLVTGPKVTVFFNSLVDPLKSASNLVLDGHAINIWRGEKRRLKGIRLTNQQRERMLQDYHTAANELGISVQSLQAVTWYIWKYTNKAPDIMPSEVIEDKVQDALEQTPELISIKEDISKKMTQGNKDLLGRLGYQYVSKNYRLGSETFIQPDDPQKERSKELINMANRNIEKGNPKKRDMLHDPPSVGITIGKKKKKKLRK